MIVVVSDIHLGTAHIPTLIPPDRDEFKSFLRYLRDDLQPDHLVLNGDIDDLWRRNIRTLTRENYDIYSLLAEIRDNKTKVHYILGNHDWYAHRDRSGRISKYNERYYDTEYLEEHSLRIPEPIEELKLTTHKTDYRFMHGHQFDQEQLHQWIFDQLALIDGDAFGDEMESTHLWLKEIRDNPLSLEKVRRLIFDFKKGPSAKQIKKMDVTESEREASLGIAIGNSLDVLKKPPSTDWLCIGHSHCPGIEADPTSNGGVVNSGAWIGGMDTYLILEQSPRIMEWNNGEPTEWTNENS